MKRSFEILVVGECSKFLEETYVIEADTYEEAVEKAKDEFIKEKNDDCYDVMSIHHTELNEKA